MSAQPHFGSFFGPSTLVALLRHRAECQGQQRALTFLADGETREEHLTYAELDHEARALAARLERMNLVGRRALLLYPPGFEFVTALFGCLYAGVVAVPAHPPRKNRSLLRLQAIAADAEASVALTTRAVRRRVRPLLEESPGLASLRWLATDGPRDDAESPWREPAIDSDTLAILQYTSGSTGQPKGVMLSHANLLHNSALIAHAFEHTRSGTGVFWLPGYHDMGLVGGIVQPLYVGRPNVLLPPMAFLQRPIRWLQAVSRYGAAAGAAVTSGGPNFAYDLCVRKITPAQLEGLDLSGWRVAFNGAEPVRAETLEAFAEKFAPCGFAPEALYPCYGLAEATLLCTGGYVGSPLKVRAVDGRELERHLVLDVPPEAAGARRVVGCGHNLPDQQVLIVHPSQRVRCPENQVGEIWVGGPSIARGYWNGPEETRETFHAHLADTGEGPFLRTGDLGFLRDGELFVTGRLKDLIILRGLNHYPQDIERTAQASHPALRPGGGAAFTIEKGSRQQLVVVQEIERRAQDAAAEAMAAMRRRIEREHDLTVDVVVLIRAGTIPKTSSGKIQRHACRRALLKETVVEIARLSLECGDLSPHSKRSADRGRLRAEPPHPRLTPRPSESGDKSPHSKTTDLVLAEVRRITQTYATQSLELTLAEAGLDSLQRVELQAALESRFGARFPEAVVPELQTLRDVVEAVHRYLGDPSTQRVRKHQPQPNIPFADYQIEQFPEIVTLLRQGQMLEQVGLANPYFHAEQPSNPFGRERIDFTSYDYLGLAHDPRVIAAAKDAVDRYGTSVSGSRLVSGERPLHGELEQALADWIGTEEAIVFVSGHATNVSVIGHLFGPGDLVLHDALAHNSIVQGCQLSGARRLAFPHNDPDALDRLLNDLRGEHRRVLVAIEGVYSMDGDVPHLPRFIDVKRRHKALLLVDEAHSLGVLGARGRGIGEHFGVDPVDIDLWMGTLSKALGSCGGYIAGSRALVRYLKYTAPGFVYSVGISPANAAAALAALEVLSAEPRRVATLTANARRFLDLAQGAGLNIGPCAGTPVVPVILGDSATCLRLWQSLLDRGTAAQAILPPAVPEHSARLRFFLTCTHTESQIRTAVEQISQPTPLAAAG